MNSESLADTAPGPVRFQEAMQMYRERTVPRKKDAAVCAEMKRSAFVHRSNGRQLAADYQRLLIEEVENVLVWRCEHSSALDLHKHRKISPLLLKRS